MTPPTKQPEKLRGIPRARTLRQGSYRLVTDPACAVMVKPAHPVGRRQADLNEMDWFLALAESGWEKAETAYYRGLEEGYEAGYDRGRQEALAAAAHFRRNLEALETALLEFYNGVERWSVKLAMALAEKVVGQAAVQHEELVRQSVRQAIQETADRTRILVRVHPADYEVLKSLRSDISALSEGIEHFKIEADESITPGSCRVEAPSGLVDADFSAQLKELRRALLPQEEAE
jgi:flagellar biosynthesis/type III secretory pathway protein FliH